MSISFSSRVETSVNKKKGSLWVQHPSAEEKRVVMIGNGVPRNDFHIFPFRTQIRDPEKGKINRQSSSILLLVYCCWFKTDMYTEEGSTTRGTDIISIFKLFPFSIFLFFLSFQRNGGKNKSK